MQKYLITIIIVLIVIIGIGWKQIELAEKKRNIAEANVKAYSLQAEESGKKTRALQLTVNQLQYFNDSVLEDLDATRKELKIKDKNLKALAAVSSSFSKTDTIHINDTIFKSPTLYLDTLIGDDWYKVSLGLRYPSRIIIKPEFKSQKHIVVSTRRETVNPPKKFFLFRWFQRKQTVVVVDVMEKNPYVSDEMTRYVEIVK
jgi:hypothetical protein